MDGLIRTWVRLIALTLATTALAACDGRLAVVSLLLAAWLKARHILGGFLHLGSAPGWLTAFMLPLGVWLAAIAAVLTLR